MGSLNKIILVGNLTADPEMRFSVEGSAVTKYRLAVSRPQKADSNEPAAVDFMQIVCFGRLAEICGEYLKKGKQVLVEGRIQVRSYTTAEGQNKWTTEIVASAMKMLEKSGGSEGSVDDMPVVGEPAGENETFDDIPF